MCTPAHGWNCLHALVFQNNPCSESSVTPLPTNSFRNGIPRPRATEARDHKNMSWIWRRFSNITVGESSSHNHGSLFVLAGSSPALIFQVFLGGDERIVTILPPAAPHRSADQTPLRKERSHPFPPLFLISTWRTSQPCSCAHWRTESLDPWDPEHR